MNHNLSTYKDGYQSVEYCSICGQEGPTLQNSCVPIETQQERMARMLGLKPNCPEDWPVDIIDRLIQIENEKGQAALFLTLNSLLRS
jgi:hypothetical protein